MGVAAASWEGVAAGKCGGQSLQDGSEATACFGTTSLPAFQCRSLLKCRRPLRRAIRHSRRVTVGHECALMPRASTLFRENSTYILAERIALRRSARAELRLIGCGQPAWLHVWGAAINCAACPRSRTSARKVCAISVRIFPIHLLTAADQNATYVNVINIHIRSDLL